MTASVASPQIANASIEGGESPPIALSSFGIEDVLIITVFGAFFLLLIMEVLHPYRRFAAKIARTSLTTNTTAFLFNDVILTLVSISSLFLVAQQYSHLGLLSGLDDGVLKWVLSFILFDLALYGWHVASHRFEFLWRFHKIHHSDKSLNVSTGFRFHVFDQCLEVIYKCLFVVVVGVDAYVVLVCDLTKTLFVLFHHSNISFKGEKWLSKIIIVPTLHRVHHSTLRSEHDSNYGIVLSIWDRLFGTRKELVPKEIGLKLIQADNLVQLFCLAFITERRIIKLLQMIPRGRR